MYLQRNIVYDNSDLCKASGFVITTELVGFVSTKLVNDILLRVQDHSWEWLLEAIHAVTMASAF